MIFYVIFIIFYVMFKATEVCLAFLFAFNGFLDNLLLFNF